ncbi:MAG TPA: integrase core domain-containing protein, partial [Terriglobales bacterium]
MFNRAIRTQTLPKYLSSDHDPLYQFQPWQANLRVLEIQKIKTVPYVPLSHPFVERLIGTIRREYLDQTLFWTAADLEEKLRAFQHYFNRHRVHSGLKGRLPEPGEEKVTLTSPPTGGSSIVADSIRHLRRRDFHEFATNKTGEDIDREIPYMKGYTVFNVEQIEGLPEIYYAKAAPALDPVARIAHAEAFFTR